MGQAAEVSWLARVEGARSFREPHFQKLDLTIQPTVDARLSEEWTLRGIARLRFDAAGELDATNGRAARGVGTRPVYFANGRGELELRELFVDGTIGAVRLRLGKQQVVWGQADGLRVLDVVNPFSLREFVLPNPEDRRIPLWTINAELPLAGGDLQLLWVADPTVDELPRPGHPFELTSPLYVPRRPAAGAPVTVSIVPAIRPGGGLESSDVGLRWSGQAGGWDLSVNYLYHHWDAPVPYQHRDVTGVRIAPRYERTSLLGGSYANAFGSITIRGELGMSTKRFFPTDDPADADGVFQARELAHVIGVDYTGIDETLISVQLFQSWISRHPAGATRRRLENQATLVVQHEAFNRALRLRALWLQSLDRGDSALQAQIAWKWRSNAVLAIGAERFDGTREGLFGQFRDASRVTLGLELGF